MNQKLMELIGFDYDQVENITREEELADGLKTICREPLEEDCE
jgi:hypothetical protein